MKQKNKGGRPRKSGNGPNSERWKQITQPASVHHYEIFSSGLVRRKLKNGKYYNLKAWVTGGPYAAVYLAGIKGATRNRKKVYVHRLVADHFLKQSKAPNKVVHHEVGPSSNTSKTLKWVTPSENNKARRFFTDDGQRKRRQKLKPKQQQSKLAKSALEKPKEKPVEKQKAPPKKALPSDPEEYYPEETLVEKINYLIKNYGPFAIRWRMFRKSMPKVTKKNFATKFREATNKKFKSGESPASWETRITSAMYEIERRLET